MATRYYFSAATTSPLNSLSFLSGWESVVGAVRAKLLSAVSGADTLADGTSIAWTAAQEALDRQYVSDRIGVTTISGTVKCQIRSQMSAANDNARTRLSVYIVSEDGTTVRGTLLALQRWGPATALAAAALRNTTYADGDAVTQVITQNGDRIVVEVGYSDASGTTPGAHSNYGSSGASDLPEDESTTTALNPWIEFSDTIAAYVSGGSVLADAGIPGPGPVGVVSTSIRGGAAHLSNPPKDLHRRFIR